MKKAFFVAILVVFAFAGCELFKTNLGVNVTGAVSNNGTPISGAITILLNSEEAINNISSLNESDLSSLTSIVKGVSKTNSSGNYTIPLVQEGTYVLVAVYDKNGNTELDSLDEIGWYGKDTTVIADNDTVTFTVPDTFVVKDVDRTGINVHYLISKDVYDSLSTK